MLASMSPKAIAEVWEATGDILNKHNIPHTRKTLGALLEEEHLHSLLQKLNAAVGSSTCNPYRMRLTNAN
ncbi:hypothetical protein [Pueribacillus theae]|nr:hypothetical protein [Pueribacillus theae]